MITKKVFTPNHVRCVSRRRGSNSPILIEHPCPRIFRFAGSSLKCLGFHEAAFLYTHTRRKCCPSQLVPSVGLEPTASCSQSRCTADCAMTTYHASSGLSGSEEADPSWRWSRWGTYPSPATGFQCWLLIRCFYPHSLSGETALVGRKVSRLSRYGRRCQHTACTSCGFAHPLARCDSSFWCRSKQLQ